jgi:tetratricopeptide (TPR) repeat protein
LGNAYDSLGQYPKAIEFYQQSLAIFQDIGNRNGEAGPLNNLGSAYINLKQYAEAIKPLSQAIEVLESLNYLSFPLPPSKTNRANT